MIASLVQKVHSKLAFQLVVFYLPQIVASGNSEPAGIVLMAAFVLLVAFSGSGTCLSTADFEGTIGDTAVVQLWHVLNVWLGLVKIKLFCQFFLRLPPLLPRCCPYHFFLIWQITTIQTIVTVVVPILFDRRIRLFFRLLTIL